MGIVWGLHRVLTKLCFDHGSSKAGVSYTPSINSTPASNSAEPPPFGSDGRGKRVDLNVETWAAPRLLRSLYQHPPTTL